MRKRIKELEREREQLLLVIEGLLAALSQNHVQIISISHPAPIQPVYPPIVPMQPQYPTTPFYETYTPRITC